MIVSLLEVSRLSTIVAEAGSVLACIKVRLAEVSLVLMMSRITKVRIRAVLILSIVVGMVSALIKLVVVALLPGLVEIIFGLLVLVERLEA